MNTTTSLSAEEPTLPAPALVCGAAMPEMVRFLPTSPSEAGGTADDRLAKVADDGLPGAISRHRSGRHAAVGRQAHDDRGAAAGRRRADAPVLGISPGSQGAGAGGTGVTLCAGLAAVWKLHAGLDRTDDDRSVGSVPRADGLGPGRLPGARDRASRIRVTVAATAGCSGPLPASCGDRTRGAEDRTAGDCPRLWRRVDVPLSSTLPAFAWQHPGSVGWTDSHRFEFVIGERPLRQALA